MKRFFLPSLLFCAVTGCSILHRNEPIPTTAPDHQSNYPSSTSERPTNQKPSDVSGSEKRTTNEAPSADLRGEKRTTKEAPLAGSIQDSDTKRSTQLEAKPISRSPENGDALSAAADALASGDDLTAAREFRRHLQKFPKQFLFRYQLAEIYFRNGDTLSAKQEFLQTIADAQEAKVVNQALLVRCHTYLVEIASEKGDLYSEHLNRGIGLCLLAQKMIEIEGQPNEQSESLVFKAIKELKQARELQPDDAVGAWYLSKCYSVLGESAQAEKMWAIARSKAYLNPLTPKELRELNETR